MKLLSFKFFLIIHNSIDETLLKKLYLVTVSKSLEDMIAGPSQGLNPDSLTVFDAQVVPPISIQDYLLRIMSYSRATSRNMVMCLCYIDQLSNDQDWPIILSRYNIHRLLVVSMMVSCKFYEDFYIDNESWATIAGMSLQEINRLERKFLTYIGFEINTKLDWFLNYVQMLLSYAVENELVEIDIAREVLQAIVDSAVQEFGDSEN